MLAYYLFLSPITMLVFAGIISLLSPSFADAQGQDND